MNETLADFIKLGAVLALAAALVMVGFRIYNANKETTNASIEQTNRLNTQIQDTEWTQYDLATVTGSEVLSCIERMESTDTWVYCGNQYFVYSGSGGDNSVDSNTGSLGTKMDDAAERAAIKNARDKANANYINPSGLYTGVVVRDTNTKAIVGIKFIAKSAGVTPTP